MASKILLKEKRELKKQQKAEREKIVNNYMIIIKDIIEEGYLEVMNRLDEFNQELMSYTIEYANLENQIIKLLKESLEEEVVLELNDKVNNMENKNEEIYHTITSRDIDENKLLKHIPVIAENVSKVLNKAYGELEGNKNRRYLISMITNRSFDIFKKYNSVIIDVALESNEYIDAYVDARENFVELVVRCKEIINEIEISEEIEQLQETVKYKQRLRVNYSDFEKFLKHKGYECNRQGNTTHAVWKHVETGKSIPLPNKSGTMPQGTTSKILKQIESNRQELAEFLYA